MPAGCDDCGTKETICEVSGSGKTPSMPALAAIRSSLNALAAAVVPDAADATTAADAVELAAVAAPAAAVKFAGAATLDSSSALPFFVAFVLLNNENTGFVSVFDSVFVSISAFLLLPALTIKETPSMPSTPLDIDSYYNKYSKSNITCIIQVANEMKYILTKLFSEASANNSLSALGSSLS